MIIAIKKRKLEDPLLPELPISLENISDPRASDWKFTNFNSNEIKIYSWNINGLKSIVRKGSLQQFLLTEDPDILCLNETKINSHKLSKYKYANQLYPEKYLFYWNCCKSSSGYSGTSIFTKVKPLGVSYDLGSVENDQEGRLITMEFEKFIVVCCYNPVSGFKLDRLKYRTEKWDPALENHLHQLELIKGKPVILCGDLNIARFDIDIYNPKTAKKTSPCWTPAEKANFEKLLGNGYTDIYRKMHPTEIKYTYWNYRSRGKEKNKGWRLDYFLISKNAEESIKESDILDKTIGSDHCPLKIIMDISKLMKKTEENPIKDNSNVTGIDDNKN